MKKSFIFLLLLLLGFSSHAFVRNHIDQKFIQLFQSSFPKAETVSWEEYPDCYTVNFTESGIAARIVYAKDESYVRFTRYYNETTMPYYVKHFVAAKYGNKKIIGVNEVSNVSKSGDIDLNYYLILEDDHKKWMIKMDSRGYTEIVDTFKKNGLAK